MQLLRLVFLLGLLASCSSTAGIHKGYPGVELSDTELATVLEQPRNLNLLSGMLAPITGSEVKFWTRIESLDGQKVSDKVGGVAVLPGEHSLLVFVASEQSSVYFSGRAELTCMIPAPGEYQLMANFGKGGGVQLVLWNKVQEVSVGSTPVVPE